MISTRDFLRCVVGKRRMLEYCGRLVINFWRNIEVNMNWFFISKIIVYEFGNRQQFVCSCLPLMSFFFINLPSSFHEVP